MSDFPNDGSTPLDAVVGSVADQGGAAPFASPDESSIRVAVSGDAAAHAGAMGLAEDLSSLVRRFIQDSPASAAAPASPPSAGERGEIGIALHGLTLDPDQEAQLRDLIRELVRERAQGGEAGR